MPVFLPPSVSLKKELLLYRREVLRADGDFDGTAGLGNFSDISGWLELLHSMEPGRAEAYGYYPTLVYLALEEGVPVGIFNVRLSDDELIRSGAGHIGYHVRQSQRNRGFAKLMLTEAVRICRMHGIAEPVVCTDPGNAASKRVALSSGFHYTGDAVTKSGIAVSRFVLRDDITE